MPVQFYSLPWHLSHSEFANFAQNASQSAQTAAQAGAAKQVSEQAKEKEATQVQNTEQTELTPIEGEERGAHSHTLPERKPKEEKPEESGDDAPDPEGRGGKLDIRL